MELNLQLTTQSKILIGVLVIVLIAAVAIQWGPEISRLISNPAMESKREILQTSKNLVAASKILKPIEVDLYQKAGLAGAEETTLIFDGQHPEAVIREKIDGIAKKAGIPQNYQLSMELLPGKRSERISQQSRRNLVVYLYQQKLEAERDTAKAEIEAEIQAQIEAEKQAEIETEEASMDMLMDAWLNETDEDTETPEDAEKSDENEGEPEKPSEENADEDAKTSENVQKSDENEVETDELSEETAGENAKTSENVQKSDENEGEPEKPSEETADEDVEKSEDVQKSDENDVESDELSEENAEKDTETSEDAEKSDENEGEPEKPSEERTEKDADESEEVQKAGENQTDSENLMDTEPQWEFASFPETIPSSIRVELIELVISMTQQHLVGAEKTLFENQFFKTQTHATSGFFGIGAKKPSNEINFRPNSQILARFTELVEPYGEELNKQILTAELLEYLEQIQSQITELSEKLQTAPTVYSPESYTVKMKFKAEVEKLVNLNRIIETTTKWLMVRDLQISADNKQNKINVDVIMIARVYQ